MISTATAATSPLLGSPPMIHQPRKLSAVHDGDDGGDEHPGDPIGQPLDGGPWTPGRLGRGGTICAKAVCRRPPRRPAREQALLVDGGAVATASPGRLSTGTDSPVSIGLVDPTRRRQMTWPSTGTFSPGRTRTTSPTPHLIDGGPCARRRRRPCGPLWRPARAGCGRPRRPVPGPGPRRRKRPSSRKAMISAACRNTGPPPAIR